MHGNSLLSALLLLTPLARAYLHHGEPGSVAIYAKPDFGYSDQLPVYLSEADFGEPSANENHCRALSNAKSIGPDKGTVCQLYSDPGCKPDSRTMWVPTYPIGLSNLNAEEFPGLSCWVWKT
ncbi:hypothetical protein K458DRAFT_389468 [Lentithecium fluviatile CBS 122367]|uniref:Uncharacterized protein n=1 Tax=Lentithecium fluviatile CBS 122367 TaxID=1168545 RepID=A0A6G1J015_9PLEO|nr:hypothetical protein K458DRAFT_389468 [Lentithecium fluviatile CBS 122367]